MAQVCCRSRGCRSVRNPSASVLEIWLERLRALYRALVRVRLPRIFGLVLRNPRDSVGGVASVLQDPLLQ